MDNRQEALKDWPGTCLELIDTPILRGEPMPEMTYLESLEQTADKLDECIEMLSPAVGDEAIDFIIHHLKTAGAHLSLAIADEQLQRAVIAREHMQDSKREDV